MAAARSAGHVVEVVPGPSAVTAALAVAGASGGGFLFGGFLPARPPTARFAVLERLVAAAGGLGLPVVLFEAPHRVSRLLGELDRLTAVHPDLRVAAARELTKIHEEVVVGTPAEVAAALPTPRGEFTLVVSGLSRPRPPRPSDAGAARRRRPAAPGFPIGPSPTSSALPESRAARPIGAVQSGGKGSVRDR